MGMQEILPKILRGNREAQQHVNEIAGILDTPPIEPRRDGLVLFSMMGTAALLPYLVAVKSLWHQLRRGRVVIMDDGTLTGEDRAVLAFHCGDPDIVNLASVDRGPFPEGGTWERFLTILDNRRDEYWIQLDSDTVTTGPVPEVESAISRNRSFALPGVPEADVGPLFLSDAARHFHPGGPRDGDVQDRIESRLDMIPGIRGWRYLRGCSGFSGFAAGGLGRPLAASFLAEMQRIIGPEDTQLWGTEQVASNFQLANEPGLVTLPHARYRNYREGDAGTDTAFLHFPGSRRYANGTYRELSRTAIAAMGLRAGS